MSFVTVAIVGGAAAVAGSYMQSQAIDRASDSQTAAAGQANNTQLAIYNQQRRDQEPWRLAGSVALSDLAKGNILPGGFEGDPGYQFRMAEGTKALNASAAARGMSQGGAQAKALTRYGQDYGSNEYNNAYNRQFNRLSTLAGFGRSANDANTSSANQYATNYGTNIMSAANAQSAGQMAQANNYAGMLNNGANMWMNYNMMNRMFPNTNGGGG